MENFSGFSVWGTCAVVATLLISLLVANLLKKTIKILHASLIPTSVLGGVILVIIAGIYKAVTNEVMFDSALFGGDGTTKLEIITYHSLALGFIASTFKPSKSKLTKQRTGEILNTGVTTVATYLLQAVVGLAITIIAAFVIKDFFSAAGVLLPFGYGQGTGQALNYGGIFESEFGFINGKSFGLTIAALGFISASVGGVIHLNILKRKGKIKIVDAKDTRLRHEDIESENEIPMQESIDKLTIQVALIAVAYAITYGIMYMLGKLFPGMSSIVYGFNFLIGVLVATLVKLVINLLRKKNIIKKEYTNDFLMTRTSNFFFDIMVVAGIAAIRLSAIKQYWGIMLILGVAGLVITYTYNLIVARTLFKNYSEEQFLMMYGMLTGTASTGTILLREIDGNFETSAADNLVYQNFPAIALGFPMMILATAAPKNPVTTLIIAVIYFIALNIFLFRSKIFKRKNKAKKQ